MAPTKSAWLGEWDICIEVKVEPAEDEVYYLDWIGMGYPFKG